MMKRTLRAAFAASAFALASACVVVPPFGVLYVHRAPPPRREEVVREAPVRGAVWIAGYWAWHSDDYVWVSGHWAQPPRGYHDWEHGKWHHNHHGWFYTPGHWH
jgi:WXXGXW repeat (2 copies)